MHYELETLRNALRHAQQLVDSIEQRMQALEASRHRDAITVNVPEGYDTVLGYLAKHHADVLDMIDYYDPSATVRDGWKLSHLSNRNLRAMSPTYVDAPPCLRAAGIERVRAYPVSLLEQRWG